MSRLVVVTGGGSGIGLACARWFVANGDRVVVVGRTESRIAGAVAELGPNATGLVADVGDPDGVERVLGSLDDSTVDVVVAAAGGTRAEVPSTLAETDRVWSEDIRQNLLTAVLTVAGIRPLLARPGGRVIALGSIGAQLGSGYGGSYGAAKAGLHAWAYWLAAELGPEGVTVNVVVPGYVPDTAFWGDRMDAEFHRVRVDASLVKRAGTTAEVAATVGFIASPDAGYITGQLIGVNGGRVLGR